MTNEQTAKAVATAKTHWPNMVAVLIGAVVAAIGWTMPEQSADVINKLMQFFGSAIAAGGVITSAVRGGVKKEMEKTAPEMAAAAGSAASQGIAEDVHLLTTAAVRLGAGLDRIQDDINAKHEENNKRHEELTKGMQALLDDRELNQQLHREHSSRFEKIETEVRDIRDGHAQIMAKLETLAPDEDKAA